MATRQIFFTISDVTGAATGSYTLVDGDGTVIFSNIDYRLLNGVTYSVIATQSVFRLTNNPSAASIEYATWDPTEAGAAIALSEGDLREDGIDGGYGMVRSTIGKSSGRWYWEATIINKIHVYIGIATATASLNLSLGWDPSGWGWGRFSTLFNNALDIPYGVDFNDGDVIGMALNMDAGNFTFYLNGSTQGVAVTGLTGTIYAGAGTFGLTGSSIANFGASTFAQTVPDGYNGGLY